MPVSEARQDDRGSQGRCEDENTARDPEADPDHSANVGQSDLGVAVVGHKAPCIMICVFDEFGSESMGTHDRLFFRQLYACGHSFQSIAHGASSEYSFPWLPTNLIPS